MKKDEDSNVYGNNIDIENEPTATASSLPLRITGRISSNIWSVRVQATARVVIVIRVPWGRLLAAYIGSDRAYNIDMKIGKGIDVIMRLTLMICYYTKSMTSDRILPFVTISRMTVTTNK